MIAIFSQRLLDGQPLIIFGDGEQTRDYVYVKDVVSANMRASDLGLGDTVDMDEVAFNVGTGVGTTVNRLADNLEEIAGLRPGREYRSERAGELRHSTLDSSALKARGWAPKFAFRDGLRETFEFIQRSRVAP